MILRYSKYRARIIYVDFLGDERRIFFGFYEKELKIYSRAKGEEEGTERWLANSDCKGVPTVYWR